MKNKRGFTLVELLGLIVILAVIAAITIPTVTGIIKKNKEKAYNATVATIIDASKKWSSDNSSMVSDTGDGCVKISHSDTYNQYEYSYETKDECPNFILDVVLTSFPELEVGDNGCKASDSTKNYSYMGGCYLKGAQTKNYLWYSGFLWRIMGINKDKTVRLITEDAITGIPYNKNNDYNFIGSYEDDWLNSYFYTRLKNNSIIMTGNFCQGEPLSNFISRSDCAGGITISRNVGLISADELSLSGGGTGKNSTYLYSGMWARTITPGIPNNDSSSAITWVLDNNNYIRKDDVVTAWSYTFPVININSTSFITSGDGTLSSTWSSTTSPYILSENKTSSITGSLADNVTSGEYVKFAGKTYRVVNKEDNGVKLILDGYYQSTAGTNDKMIYGTSNTFSTTSGIGQTLNTTIYNWLAPTDSDKSKIIKDYSWYQNNFAYGDKYTVSLNETNPTRMISATVGLIRIGEMLSGQSYTMVIENHYKVVNWILNSNANNLYAFYIEGYMGINSYYGQVNTSNFAVSPVIVVNNSTQITSGTGTPSNPYQI